MTHRKSLILLATLLATSATGMALAAGPAKPATPRIDANGDGLIDRQEAAAHPRLAQRFDELDKNKDGKLSREELPRWQARGEGRHDGGRHMRGGHRGAGFMAVMDSDKDGRISAAEHRAFFEQMDVNKDGYLDKADREARAKQRRDEWFSQADTDKDGKLSQAELDAARAKAGPRGPRAPAPASK